MNILNNYILQRLKITFKKKGLKGLLISIINYLNSKLNPNLVGEMPFKYLFLKKRRLIKKFAEENLDKLDDIDIITIGNYLVKQNLINSKSIVYSFGVGNSISFEEKFSKKFNCKVFCYDPTSIAKNFMGSHEYDKNKINFKDYGIWVEDKKIKFFKQNEKNESNTGGSITNIFGTQSYDLLQCYKLKTLMKQNNHNKLDLIKLDIEGASVVVIKNFTKEGISPDQIVVEFEYSEDDKIVENEFINWSNKLTELVNLLKEHSYKCYYLPRYSHLPYSTIEVLFVKKISL